MEARPIRCDIYRTAIAMRSFEHAAASRDLAEAVVVRVEFSDGSFGWGETLPRSYVTGESIQSVSADVENTLWPALPSGQVPLADAAGRCIQAAACAIDLACWPRLPCQVQAIPTGFAGGEGGLGYRVSGVLGSADAARTARQLRLMWWYGLRDFKLKLGLGPQSDRENLRHVHARLKKAIAAGKATLRVDVNGGWTIADTPRRVAELARCGVCVVEQPVFCPAGEFVQLARQCELPLMADESLVTVGNATILAAEPARVWWNLRISKNGGLAATMNLARLAVERGVPFVCGCMVGESGILSSAQRLLLGMMSAKCGAGAGPRFVEGNYGRLLLKDDLTTKSLRFGYGGRLPAPAGRELAVAIDPRKLARYGTLIKTLRA